MQDPMKYAKRVLARLLYFYPNINMDILDCIHASLPDRSTFLQFSQFLSYNHPALSYYKGVELASEGLNGQGRSVQELIRVLTFLLAADQTNSLISRQSVPTVDIFMDKNGREAKHYPTLAIDLDSSPWSRELSGAFERASPGELPNRPTASNSSKINTFLEKAILEVQKRSVSNSEQGSFAHVVCSLTGLDPQVVGLAYASAIRSAGPTADPKTSKPSVQPLLPIDSMSSKDIEVILTKSLSSDSDPATNISKLSEHLAYDINWESVSKAVHANIDAILKKLTITVSLTDNSQTKAYCKTIKELALGLYQVNFRRKDINKVVINLTLDSVG